MKIGAIDPEDSNQEKRDMRARRPLDEILYVLMCVLFSCVVTGGSIASFFIERDRLLFARGTLVVGILLNFLLAARNLIRGRRISGLLCILMAVLSGLMIFF